MINFPDSPVVDETFTVEGITYIWDGVKWKAAVEALALVATTGSYTDLLDKPTSSWSYISANTTLSANVLYGVDFSASRTLTLPASPLQNDKVYIYSTTGDSTGSVIARNGSTIMGLLEDLTIDSSILSLELVYSGSTWRITLL